MTGLDWLILAATALLALSGYFRGFIVAALSLVGFALGAIAGTRVAALLLPAGAASPYAPLFGLIGALVAGAMLASGFERLGLRIRRALPLRALGILDGLGGALFGAVVALGIAWITGAILIALPGAGSLRATIARSLILRRLDELLPPSGVLLHAIATLDPLPGVEGSTANIPPVSAAIVRGAAVRGAQRSVVRILGTACGLGIEGSGWVVAPGEVLTNAHVVAGERDTTVERHGDHPELAATVCCLIRAMTSRCCAWPALTCRRSRWRASRRGAPRWRSSATPRTARSSPSPVASGGRRTSSPRTPTAAAR